MVGTAERTCRCGHTRNHPMVIPEREYTLWGWILLSMFGLTPKPECVVFRCGLCRQTLGSTRDPKVLSGETRVDPKHPGSPKSAERQPPSAPVDGDGGAKNAER